MAMYKYIYWRPDAQKQVDGMTFANVHVLVGYNQCSLVDFRQMADQLRETFPQARDEEIIVGKVFASSYVKGFAIVTWNAHIPAAEYPGWEQKDDGRMEYHW